MTNTTSSAKHFSTNREAALFYLEALRDDTAKAANNYYFQSKFVSYGDAREKTAKLDAIISQFRSCFDAYREPTLTELRSIEGCCGDLAA